MLPLYPLSYGAVLIGKVAQSGRQAVWCRDHG